MTRTAGLTSPPLRVVLADRNPALKAAWLEQKLHQFVGERGPLNSGTRAVVSPANSVGHMNGGIDKLYVDTYGQQLEDRVRDRIVTQYGGHLPVGRAFVIRTLPEGQPIPEGLPEILVVAPTMTQPRALTNADTVYRAALAALRATDEAGLESVAFPGMGTGVGRLSYREAAEAMARALDDFMDIKSGRFGLTYEQAVKDFIAEQAIDERAQLGGQL